MKAKYHLPGLFEFFELYKLFLPLFYEHREYFYDWCDIASIYGAPTDCIWGGGRIEASDIEAKQVLDLVNSYGISARLTFSNSLIRTEHLSDVEGNSLCRLFESSKTSRNGVIIYSDLLLDYIREHYPKLYFVSSTTKVIRDFDRLIEELDRREFDYVVPDFRLNKSLDRFRTLEEIQKNKIELLCNECCDFACPDRLLCYENVSRRIMGETLVEHQCRMPGAKQGYVFSTAMKNPGFIGLYDIQNVYLPMGINNFKIEGRSLGSAIVLEFLLYYMTKPEYQLLVREAIYLDNMLDLF